MANIIQHEPLRVPSRWSAEERALVLQMERVIEDLYRNITLLKRKIETLEQQTNGGEST